MANYLLHVFGHPTQPLWLGEHHTGLRTVNQSSRHPQGQSLPRDGGWPLKNHKLLTLGTCPISPILHSRETLVINYTLFLTVNECYPRSFSTQVLRQHSWLKSLQVFNLFSISDVYTTISTTAMHMAERKYLLIIFLYTILNNGNRTIKKLFSSQHRQTTIRNNP